MTTYFPKNGRSAADVRAVLDGYRAADLSADGRAFAFRYDAGAAVREVARDAFASSMSINGLDPTVYPSARKIENGVVHACLELMRAPDGACGTATAGGTESVMLAVKAARDHARRHRPNVTSPKILLPETAHACFHKAAHYLGVEVVLVGVDASFRANVEDARAKMTSDVILVVGSAPSYAHGVIDPIGPLADLAAEHGALMHVDACVGGCVLPFMRMNGETVSPFDFTVPGVASISLDLHKYGFAPKGISVLLHRTRAVRDAQYFACARWSGYSIVNATTLGSKSCSAMAAAFAVIHHLGLEGYRARANEMWAATNDLVRAIEELDGVRLLARPEMNLLAFTTTDGGDVFALADRLTEAGWLVQPTYAFGASPAHIHLTLNPENAARIDDFIGDLAIALVDLPPAEPPPAAIVQLLEGIADAPASATGALMGQLGIVDGRLPAKASVIHRMLNAASPEVRERLLTLFLGELFS